MNRRQAMAIVSSGLFINITDDAMAIRSAGLNDKEADCWRLVAEAAGKLLELEELHPSEKPEMVAAIHGIQCKLLARPTYRKYLAEAKKM